MDAPELWSTAQRLWTSLSREQQAVVYIAACAGLGVLVALWLYSLALRRTRDFAIALDDCVRGSYVTTSARAGLVRGDIQPPPAPFRAFSAELRMRGPLGGIPALGRQTLTFSGQLVRRPSTELIWSRGRIPERALGRGSETRLWILRRLDVAPGDYAIRGSDTPAVDHVLADLQTRFAGCTHRIRILGEAQPDFEIEFDAGGIGPEEIPALIATIRALARAALGALPH